MSNKNRTWIEENAGTIVEEATREVWKKMEKALEGLDASSVEVLNEFHDGSTAAAIAKKRGITTQQASDWIAQIKRELNQQLRTVCKVRH